MTRGDFITLAALAAVLWPWAICLVDVAAWAVTGATLSGIPWTTSTRGLVLVFWPFVWIAALLIVTL